MGAQPWYRLNVLERELTLRAIRHEGSSLARTYAWELENQPYRVRDTDAAVVLAEFGPGSTSYQRELAAALRDR